MQHNKLDLYCVGSYAYWTQPTDPTTRLTVPGLGVNSVFRLNAPGGGVKLEQVVIHAIPLDLDPEPDVTMRADRVIVETYTSEEADAKIIFDGKLDWVNGSATVPLHGSPAIAVGIRCHEKHPIKKAAFGILHPQPWIVPYSMFTSPGKQPEWWPAVPNMGKEKK